MSWRLVPWLLVRAVLVLLGVALSAPAMALPPPDTGGCGVYKYYYLDEDCDGYTDGTKGYVSALCDCYVTTAPTSSTLDCDDTDYYTNPGARETCDGADNDCDGTVDDGVGYTYYKDADGDGYGAGTGSKSCSATTPTGYSTKSTDCNDASASVSPGATETCNSVDDDCDGSTDEGVTYTYYKDSDGDGYGVSTSTTSSCSTTAPSGYSSKSTDCNDSNKYVYPTAAESCNSTDDDCDGTIDEGVTSTFYKDGDGDGYGTSSSTSTGCSAPTGYVSNSTDCNDSSSSIKPGATETCNSTDDDCDGSTDEGLTSYTYYKDSDGDGYGGTSTTSTCSTTTPSGYSSTGGDCNDSSTAVKPGAAETCNSTDDDCDGSTDEGLTSYTYYKDSDGDGYGGTSTTSSCSTSAPSGYTATSGDCNDSSTAVKPGATETCNSTDDDCDGTTDEGVTTTFYKDADGDGYGNASSTTAACSAPTGYVSNGTDCNDTSASVKPGATETCNSVDDDCDGSTDEGVKTTYYKDADGDGYGVTTTTTTGCSKPSGYASTYGDCNDASASVSPGATETCNSTDDDCDGTTDEGVKITYYKDADGDGYGVSTSTTTACSLPTGYSTSSTDCNDASSSISPSATETCNSTDDDCDGSTDEGVKTTYYKDGDGDGYGTSGTTTSACSAPAGYVSDKTDCNDASASVKPGATETCNSVDDDCDGTTDEGVKTTYYKDADSDGYGVSTSTTSACSLPSGYSTLSTDCNDASASVYPGATEACDGVDNDCDGTVDSVIPTWYRDSDGDGYGTSSTTMTQCTQPSGYVGNSDDCNDSSKSVSPAASESCNSVDDDCDGTVDDGVKLTYYRDADGDGYGDGSGSGTASCTAPTGYVADTTDCDDSKKTVNPGASETCNSTDDDCDGSTDESATDASTWYLDADGDAHGDATITYKACSAPAGYVATSDDCDDSEASVGGPATWYADYDTDGYGVTTETKSACEMPVGFAAVAGDCDDADATLNPDGVEAPNGFDDDCDGIVDDETVLYDDDGDGYTEKGGDCDDDDALASPAMTESCDGIDEDCNGEIDDGTECFDDDGDSYDELTGDCNDADPDVSPGATELLGNGLDDDCDGTIDDGNYDGDGDGYSDTAGDCDPYDGDVYPGAPEQADGVDNDCDEIVDEGTANYDDDGDGLTEGEGDCDDGDDGVYPDAEETPDGVDENCDGTVDEGTVAYDDDGDGATEEGGDCDDANADVGPGQTETAGNGLDDDCDGSTDEADSNPDVDDDGDGYTAAEGDCDDADGGLHPGATEVCNGYDDDCNGSVDDLDCEGDGAQEEKGCATPVGGGVGLLPILLAAALLARRRA
jgi:hypothetical protein